MRSWWRRIRATAMAVAMMKAMGSMIFAGVGGQAPTSRRMTSAPAAERPTRAVRAMSVPAGALGLFGGASNMVGNSEGGVVERVFNPPCSVAI